MVERAPACLGYERLGGRGGEMLRIALIREVHVPVLNLPKRPFFYVPGLISE